MINKILRGRYQIIRHLVDGGFSETYLAQDLQQINDNRCVVKRLKPDIINHSNLDLFKKEAKILEKLGSHDQIPKFLDYFQEDQEFYLVQEFIEGRNLSQEIKLGEQCSETDVIKLLEDILEVLDFVHQNHVIHRDIKPANIMRRDNDRKIVLIDFGGVKQVKTNTSASLSTAGVGTPGYMPQEQIENKAQLCSDIYAVGMVAIQALTGENPADVLKDRITLQPIWRDKAFVGNRLADILDRMVRFDFTQRYQSASEALEAVKSLSFTANEWYNQGEKLYQLQRYSEAFFAFDQAIQIQPDYAQAWKNRGIMLTELDQFNEAITSFDQAIKIQPDYAQAWDGRAWALYNLGGYEEVIISFNKAISIKPNYYEAYYHRGIVLGELSQYDKAIASFDYVIQIQPDNADAWYYRGLMLNSLKKYKKAITSFKQAIKFRENYADAWYNHGLALTHLRRHQKAIKSFDYVIQIQPKHYQAWCSRGLALYKLTSWTEAVTSCNKALNIKPDYQEGIKTLDLINQRGIIFIRAFIVSGVLNIISIILVVISFSSYYNFIHALISITVISLFLLIAAQKTPTHIRDQNMHYTWPNVIRIYFLNLLLSLKTIPNISPYIKKNRRYTSASIIIIYMFGILMILLVIGRFFTLVNSFSNLGFAKYLIIAKFWIIGLCGLLTLPVLPIIPLLYYVYLHENLPKNINNKTLNLVDKIIEFIIKLLP
ncbi:MAG: tetratricopeptide repeat protein [Nostoc sp.]|uniref:tetratricopeptide repeat protein n=1 Tax=Nostoc sp. TaxID=1180 RepID=UPI002FF9066F